MAVKARAVIPHRSHCRRKTPVLQSASEATVFVEQDAGEPKGVEYGKARSRRLDMAGIWDCSE